jgi:magnesium-transporting ATPase (P-type)
MDVLCTDKTGTLTEGLVQLEALMTVAARRRRKYSTWRR